MNNAPITLICCDRSLFVGGLLDELSKIHKKGKGIRW